MPISPSASSTRQTSDSQIGVRLFRWRVRKLSFGVGPRNIRPCNASAGEEEASPERLVPHGFGLAFRDFIKTILPWASAPLRSPALTRSGSRLSGTDAGARMKLHDNPLLL